MMGVHVIRVPDIGEGITETEIAEWLVKPGDLVAEDQAVAAMMTDKATVEVASPVAGRVIALAADEGTTLAVGAELIRLEVEGAGNVRDAKPAAETPAEEPSAPPAPPQATPLAAPAIRALARERGIDLQQVTGTGPEGRILREDIEAFAPAAAPAPAEGFEDIKIIGLRKRIAQRMEEANRIPQITIIEEVDVTALDTLRERLNTRAKEGQRLTFLPFVARAIVVALADQPMLNAHHDADRGVIRRFGPVHIGIATQTPQGLVVPVLRDAQARDLTSIAAEIARLAEAAREGRATRDELAGSTLTITSLGPLGALASTPILNVPEVAIVGVNRIATRPFWTGTAFEPRRMMNLSCSFDHRVIDGYDGAVFVQRIKELLETPALMFVQP